jgi:hypothetical protein
VFVAQGVSKRALQLWKLIPIYSEDMCSVLNFHNVANHAEFYLGYLRFNMTSTGNAACFKKSSTVLIQLLMWGYCYTNVYS